MKISIQRFATYRWPDFCKLIKSFYFIRDIGKIDILTIFDKPPCLLDLREKKEIHYVLINSELTYQ
jgi:hypothetical protein